MSLTKTELGQQLFGRRAAQAARQARVTGSSSAGTGGGVSQGGSTVRYGTAASDSADGYVSVLLDGNAAGNEVSFATSAPVKKGDRVKLVWDAGGSYVLYAIDTLAGQVAEGVTGADMEYALSDSGTVPPSSGWGTEPKVPEAGQFLWQRMVVTTPGGKVTKDPQVVTGGKGEGGITPTAVVEEWYLSDSQTEQVGGNWSTVQPAGVSGKYIWMRTSIAWSDGTVTYGETVLANALNQSLQQYEVLSAELQQNVDNITIQLNAVSETAQVGADLDSDVRGFFTFDYSENDPTLTIGASNSPMVMKQTNTRQVYEYNGSPVLTIDGENQRIASAKVLLGRYEWQGADTDNLRLVYVG